jgi:hypothetical protein
LTAVAELIPGDLVTQAGTSAIFIARSTHPLWPNLQLVVWRLDDGSWSHDALDARQDVGDVEPAGDESRTARLRAALLGEGAIR